jgi:hypothetical protein
MAVSISSNYKDFNNVVIIHVLYYHTRYWRCYYAIKLDDDETHGSRDG